MPWTDEDVNRLVELVDRGLSALQIGQRMKRTRNQVMGKVHRLHLQLHGAQTVRPVRGPRLSRREVSLAVSLPAIETSGDEGRKPLVTPLDPPKFDRVTDAVMHLEPRHCRWPIGDPQGARGEFTFCCEPRAMLSPYCQFHSMVAYPKR